MNENTLQKNELGKEKLGFAQIPRVIEYLQSLGLQLTQPAVQIMENGMTESQKESIRKNGELVLVKDGSDGIRLSKHYMDADKLTVWFTNGFDSMDHPTRKQINAWIKENYE